MEVILFWSKVEKTSNHRENKAAQERKKAHVNDLERRIMQDKEI